MIEEIRRFILVAKNGNLTNTAEQIFITQSALTQSIHRLEKELKTKLFIRKGKTLQITPDGKSIIEIGSKILELWDKAKSPDARIINNPTFTIGLFDSAALKLGKFFSKKELPAIDLTIGGSGKLISQLQLGTIDVAVCVIDKKNLQPKNLTLLKTFNELLIPVASRKYNEKINTIPFILYNKGSNTRNQIDEEFTKHGLVANVFAESTSVSFMKELAILGNGIALLPKSYVETEIQQGLLKKQNLPIEWQRSYGIYIHKNGILHDSHPLIKELIDHLK